MNKPQSSVFLENAIYENSTHRPPSFREPCFTGLDVNFWMVAVSIPARKSFMPVCFCICPRIKCGHPE
jgi:hypothetical protein